MTRLRALALLACLALLALAGWPARAESPKPGREAPTLVIGVLPIHSTRVLVQRYEPLRAYLAAHLKQDVVIESAPDFARFHARTLRGDFDLTITPAHFARLAQLDAGFQPLVQFAPDHDSQLVYNADHPWTRTSQLKGKSLAVIDRLAITVMAALHDLSKQGLEPGVDFQVVEHRTHASVAHALVSGLSMAAVTTSQGMMQIPEDLRGKLVVYRHIADIPAFVFLAKPGTGQARAGQLKHLLLAFPNEMEGIDFMGRSGYTGLVPVSEATMKRVDPYLKQTRLALKP